MYFDKYTGDSGYLMKAEFNKSSDLPRQERVWTIPMGNLTEDEEIIILRKAIKKLNNYNQFHKVEYFYPFPSTDIIFGNNSNSWLHGFLLSLGLNDENIPNILSDVRATGWATPLSLMHFEDN